MGWFKKKADPLSERARALGAEIAALEAQIKKLNSRLDTQPAAHPRLRSTAVPHGPTLVNPSSAPPPAAPAAPPREPVFEDMAQNPQEKQPETANTPEHYNELGVRKYDLLAAWRRIRNHFRGPPSPHPQLVNYLAAGSLQGLRPLRYEKRVARNRFLVFVIVLFLAMLGILKVLWRH